MTTARDSLRTKYQLLAYVGDGEGGVSDAQFIKAAWILYDWMRREASPYILLPQLPSTISDSAKAGQSAAAIYEPEQSFFTMCYTWLSEESMERNMIEAELRPHGPQLCLAVRQTGFREAGAKRSRQTEPPPFIAQLIREVSLNDGQPVTAAPWRISASTVYDLVSFLQSPKRKLPVVLISQAKNPGIGVNGYLLDARAFAKSMTGIAHVAELEWDAAFELSRSVGTEWSCFGGAVRIYWPEPICFELDDPYLHPLYTARTMQSSFYNGSGGPEYELQRLIHSRNTEMPMNWSAHGIQFYVEAAQERMLSASGTVRTEVLLQQCQEQLRRVHQSLEEYKALAEEYFDDLCASRKDSETLYQQVQAMAAMVDRQRREILRLKSGKKEMPPINQGYEKMQEWVTQYYPDRLYLHPRAVRALKSAVYQNPSLVYRCLILLAEDYYDYRKGRIGRDEFSRRCGMVDTGLSECGFGSASDILEQGEEYYIMYGGRRRLLDRHLKKGVSRNPLYCLRIYFFWDEKTSHVVIGSLPGHLRSSLT